MKNTASPTAPMRSRSWSPPALPEPEPEPEPRPELEPGFAVYIHWPFCLSKCPYCDFNSHVVREIDAEGWSAALDRELAYFRGLTGPRRVDSIFFGGGTPSLMPVATVEAALETVARLWSVSAGTEISLEANPTSVEADRFRGFARAGVNRISLGIQALNNADLKFLGRLHSADEALGALEVAQTYFNRVSLDLIYARPGQTVEQWTEELARVLALGLDHLSLYQLTIEENTPFATLYRKQAFMLPGEDGSAALFEATQSLCDAAGRPAYEISNHARPGAECRHNLVYWRYGDYVGAGPGAHGRLTIDGVKHATQTIRAPQHWRQAVESAGHGIEEKTPISAAGQGDEMMLMGLRLAEGVSRARYEKISRRTIDGATLGALIADELIEQQNDRICASASGRLVLNRLLGELL